MIFALGFSVHVWLHSEFTVTLTRLLAILQFSNDITIKTESGKHFSEPLEVDVYYFQLISTMYSFVLLLAIVPICLAIPYY